MGCWVAVPQDRVTVVEKCGKFDKLAPPGCSCLPLPIIWRAAGSVSTRVQQLTTPVSTKTKDNVFVTVTVAVQFVVLPDPEHQYSAFYKLMNPSHQITAYVEDGVRACVPSIDLDNVFLEKDHIARAIHDSLNKEMEFYGYKIVGTLVVDVVPDDRIKYEMNEINVSRRMRIANTEKAESEKLSKIKAAEAQAEATYLAGEGMARQRKAIVEGLRESVDLLTKDVSATSREEVMELILVTQYFDTLREISTGKHSNVVFSSRRKQRRLGSGKATSARPGSTKGDASGDTSFVFEALRDGSGNSGLIRPAPR